MDIITFLKSLTAGEATLVLVGILSLVQITPIKINPWSALFKWLGRMINGELSDKIDALAKKVDKLEAKEDERDAVNKRVRILRFEDELQRGQRHTKDSFDQALSDITDYESYCAPGKHPEFRNNQTTATVEHIKKVYAERLERHDFL